MVEILTSIHSNRVGLDSLNRLVVYGEVISPAQAVAVMDFIPSGLRDAIAARTITDADWEAVRDGIQAAIDGLPDTGGAVFAPPGLYPATNIRLDGTSGNKVNVTLYGAGPSTHFRKPANSAITSDEDKRSNVVAALDGRGHRFRDAKVEGNHSRGGLKPLYGAVWAASTAYTYTGTDTTVYTTKADGTPVTPGDQESVSLANGGRMFLLRASHTSGAANILADLAANRWLEVTSQVWDEDGTGYLGYYEDDDDYAYRHGVYFHGTTAALEDCSIERVEATDCVYGGIVTGSGPLFATRVEFGADRTTISDCYSYDNQGSNFGGGHSRFLKNINPRSSGGESSGIRLDRDSDDSEIINPLVIDGSGLNNAGIFVYQSDRCKVIAPKVRETTLAIWFYQGADCELIAPDVVGGQIVIDYAERGSWVGGGVTGSASDGAKVRYGEDFDAVDFQISGSNGHGILWEDMIGGVLAPGTTRENDHHGVYMKTWRKGTFRPGVSHNNGIDTGISSPRAGYMFENCDEIAGGWGSVGDTRDPGSRTQTHGVYADADCTSIVMGVAAFGLLTAYVSDLGTGNDISTLIGGSLTLKQNVLNSGGSSLALQVAGVTQALINANAAATEWVRMTGGITANVSSSPSILPDGPGTNNNLRVLGKGTGGVQVSASGQTLGFYGLAPLVTKQTVSGAKGSNAALGSLIAALVAYGLITDSTSA